MNNESRINCDSAECPDLDIISELKRRGIVDPENDDPFHDKDFRSHEQTPLMESISEERQISISQIKSVIFEHNESKVEFQFYQTKCDHKSIIFTGKSANLTATRKLASMLSAKSSSFEMLKNICFIGHITSDSRTIVSECLEIVSRKLIQMLVTEEMEKGVFDEGKKSSYFKSHFDSINEALYRQPKIRKEERQKRILSLLKFPLVSENESQASNKTSIEVIHKISNDEQLVTINQNKNRRKKLWPINSPSTDENKETPCSHLIRRRL